METRSPLARLPSLPAATCMLLLYLLGTLLSPAATGPSEAGRYRASVIDLSGQPVAGAVVEVYRYPDERGRALKLAANVTTGADGKFEIPWVNYSRFIVRKPGLAPAWRELRPDETNNAPIVLSPPTTLAGVVVDEAGKPVIQAEVFVCGAHTGAATDWTTLVGARLTRPLFSARTDAEGHFQIGNFPTNATAELSVIAPGKVLPPRRVQYSPQGLLWRSGQRDIRLVVEPPAEIEGRVETETGGLPTDAQVELRPTGSSFGAGSWESVKGVTNGAFHFTGVASGAYQLFAQFGTNQLEAWVVDPVPVTLRAGQHLQGLVLNAAKGGVLRVRCIDKRIGGPFKGVFLTLYRTQSDFIHRTTDSGGLGWYRLMPGRYDLHGTTDEGLHQYAPAQVEAGQTNEVTLEFSPPPIVSGVVRDPDGKPAPGADVWPTDETKAEMKTDSNGRYQLVHSRNPQVVVVVDAARNLAVSREIEDGVTNLDLQLALALTVTGRVQDSQGTPIDKARVLVYMHSGTWGLPAYWQRIRTDAQGAFKVTGLPDDRSYYLQVNAAGFGSAQPNVPTDEGNSVELPPVHLNKADLPLSGQIVDASETPLANAWINVNGFGQPDINIPADSQGRFALDVCPGRVHFWVRFENLQTSIDANAGDTNLVVVLKPHTRTAEAEKPKRPSLTGRALPSLAVADIPSDAALAGKPLLLCLFDCEQRPSRQAIRLLTELNESLRQKGVTVLAIQASVASESFSRWQTANPVPFKLGRITEKTAASAWATETDMLPWLILVNSQGRVVSEGFPLEDLTGKIDSLSK